MFLFRVKVICALSLTRLAGGDVGPGHWPSPPKLSYSYLKSGDVPLSLRGLFRSLISKSYLLLAPFARPFIFELHQLRRILAFASLPAIALSYQPGILPKKWGIYGKSFQFYYNFPRIWMRSGTGESKTSDFGTENWRQPSAPLW